VKKLLTFIFALLCPLLGVTQSIDRYIEFKKEYVSLDSLISNKEFKLAYEVLSKRDLARVPKDFIRGYYSFWCEYYLAAGDYDKSIEFARQVVLHGAGPSYIKYLELNYDSTEKYFVNNLKNKYPLWEKEVASHIDTGKRKLLDKMYNSDQGIRHLYNSFIVNGSQEQKDSILMIMKEIDTRNIRIYDSIAESMGGWIFKDSLGLELKNYHIILAHNEDSIRYKYISKGYDFAKKNLIEWNEIIGIQVFAFRKSDLKDRICFLNNFSPNNSGAVHNDYNRFICYCLSVDLTAPGNRSKKIKLYINHRTAPKNDNSYIKILERIKKSLIQFGVDASSVIIDKNNYRKQFNDTKDFVIGIEYL
jgi:hypothetical protein